MVNILFAADLMEKEVLFVESTEKVYALVNKMAMNYASYALVKKAGSVVGIITYSDIVVKVLNAERNLHETTAEQIMASPVEEVQADKLVMEACDMMNDKDIDKLIVKEGLEIRGVLTQKAILKNIHRLAGE